MATETAALERIPAALALSKLEAARMLGVSIRTVDRLIKIFSGVIIRHILLDNLAARLYSPGVPNKDTARGEIRAFLRKIGSKGGKARAKKYSTKTIRAWAKKSGAGRPPKRKRED
jgi:hypothetical protein